MGYMDILEEVISGLQPEEMDSAGEEEEKYRKERAEVEKR